MFKHINWRYTIGEIVIVIIGISIAFALNRWAESSKDQQARQQYLESLLTDLEGETEQLVANIGEFEGKINDIRSLFPFLYGRQEGRDSAMSRKVFNLAQVIHFHPNDVTYRTLINSGDFALFQNFELRKKIENHYSDQELIQMDYSRQSKIHEKYFGDFMIYNLDYSQIRQGNYDFIDDPFLRNIIQSLYGSYSIAIESSQEGIERCKDLKSLLEAELGSSATDQ